MQMESMRKQSFLVIKVLAYNSHKKMVKELLEDEKFNQDNVEYVQIAFGYHSARSWRVAFYDSLQRFFK